jgi:PEP-CTERM motif
MKRLFAGALAAGIMTFAMSASASAAVYLYNFTLDGMTGSPLPAEPPYWGTVSVNDFGGTGHLYFDVKLNSSVPVYFQDSKAFHAFDYLLTGTVTNTIISTAGFTSAGAGTYYAPSIVTNGDSSSFNWAILCATVCAGGSTDGTISELMFDVYGTNLGLGFINGTNAFPNDDIYFGADVAYEPVGAGVSTGNIGATFVSSVPEPATWAMMILGFGMVGYAMRRRRSMELARA